MSKDIIESNHCLADDSSLARRKILELICRLGACVAGAALASCNLADAQNPDQTAHAGHTTARPARYQDLLDAAVMCVNRGETCFAHCTKQLGAGDASVKDCMSSVATMLPMCAAVARLAALDAPRLKDAVKLCVDVCTDCEKECRKHEQNHAQCKNCADSCAAFIREGKKMINV